MKKFLIAALVVMAMVVLTVACFDHVTGPTIVNDNQNNNGTQPTPSASATPTTGSCEVGRVDLGTMGDDFELKAGEAIGLSVSLYGAQGVELVETCRNQVNVIYDAPTGPCGPIEGAWYAAKIRALPSALAGQTCTTVARSGVKASSPLTVTVTN